MYFIYSENDDTVVPSKYEEPLIERLKAAGASNLHVSTTPDIHDLTGSVTDEDGSPHQYAGHFAWVYFLNNQSKDNESGLTAWDFIAQYAH